MGNQKKATAEHNGVTLPADNGVFSLISNEKLLALYAGLLTCRQQGTNANGKTASMWGHEAALVGATIDLGAGDTVYSREHGVLTGFSDGTAIPAFLLQSENHGLGTSRNGKAAYKAGSNGAAPASGPAYTHAAIGTALAHKTKTNRKVAVVFSREESFELLREALHIATVHALPMVFVHQPGGDGDRAGGKRGRSKKKALEHKTPWFPSITVDCHDVVALYRVSAEAISRARLGRGPTLIECRPYRLNGGRADRNGVHAENPVLHMEHYLRARGLLDESLKRDGMEE